MSLHRSLVVLLLATLSVIPSLASAKEAQEPSTDHAVVNSLFDLLDDQLAWVSPTAASLDIYYKKLPDGPDLLLTRVPLVDPTVRVDSIAFDGRWVVWTDNRYGQFEIFTVEPATLEFQQRTRDPADDRWADVDAGHMVWIRRGQVLAQDVGGGPIRVLFEQPDNSDEPTISGDRIVWGHVVGVRRQVWTASYSTGAPRLLADSDEALFLHPATTPRGVFWVMGDFREPGTPKGGIANYTLQWSQNPDDPNTQPLNISRIHRMYSGITANTQRVAWVERHPEFSSVAHYYDLDGIVIMHEEGTVRAVRLSPQYMVMDRPHGDDQWLFATSLGPSPESRDTPSIPFVLAAAGLCLACALRRYR